MESLDVWGSNSSKALGKKYCKGVCKDNSMKFTFDHMECFGGLQAMNDSRGWDGVICANMKIKEVRVKDTYEEDVPNEGGPGLNEIFWRNGNGSSCDASTDYNKWARMPDSEQYYAGVTRYWACRSHHKLVEWFGTTWEVEEENVPLSWTKVLPPGCITEVGSNSVFQRKGVGSNCGPEASGICYYLGYEYINEPGTGGTKRGRGWREGRWLMCDIERGSTIGEDERCSDFNY